MASTMPQPCPRRSAVLLWRRGPPGPNVKETRGKMGFLQRSSSKHWDLIRANLGFKWVVGLLPLVQAASLIHVYTHLPENMSWSFHSHSQVWLPEPIGLLDILVASRRQPPAPECWLRSSGVCWAHAGSMLGLCWGMLDHLGPMLGHVGPCWAQVWQLSRFYDVFKNVEKDTILEQKYSTALSFKLLRLLPVNACTQKMLRHLRCGRMSPKP